MQSNQDIIFDTIALGESLIDFTPSGVDDSGMTLFSRNPGGAPANVLAMNARLGGKTAFIGKVGDDDFGHFLKSNMQQSGIDVSGLSMTTEYKTSLAFVQLNEFGERSFSFYRNPGADLYLKKEDVEESLLSRCRIFHFGSVSLTDEPCRSTTFYTAGKAKELGTLISFDPNYRPFLWENEKCAREEIQNALQYADMIKVSEEELELLTDTTDIKLGAEKLTQYGACVVLVTLGPKGAFFYTEKACGHVPTYNVKTVDTTGAGDAFLGAFHHCIRTMTADDLKSMSALGLHKIIRFCNAAGSLTTSKKGAIPAMPTLEQIEECVERVSCL